MLDVTPVWIELVTLLICAATIPMAFVHMLTYRSGTAATQFAWLIIAGLWAAIGFGRLSFLTQGTVLLIVAQAASATLLARSAVFHTGRHNFVLAISDGLLIFFLLGTAAAITAGFHYLNTTLFVAITLAGCLAGVGSVAITLLKPSRIRTAQSVIFLVAGVLLARSPAEALFSFSLSPILKTLSYLAFVLLAASSFLISIISDLRENYTPMSSSAFRSRPERVGHGSPYGPMALISFKNMWYLMSFLALFLTIANGLADFAQNYLS